MSCARIYRNLRALFILPGAVAALAAQESAPENPAGWTLTVWNDLGMHCVDEDFSVFAILPPFNTLNAHLLDPNGKPIDDAAGVTLTYEAERDLDGSITQTAQRSNFWDYADELFGAVLSLGQGLAGSALPGPDNTPQPMRWVAAHDWWEATGIPVLPQNESGFRQAYPLFRVTARNANGTLLAEAHVVAPVSAEMNCIQCHGSGTHPAAEPSGGWVEESDPVRDYRLNILKLHDGRQTLNAAYAAALGAKDYDLDGLYATVTRRDQPILCASCHASAALGAPGLEGIPAMTAVMHGKHASVVDPATGVELGDAINRESCYQCHPGRQTRCLRGAMGNARAPDGGAAMSCQSCHGGMEAVGDLARVGWMDEPNCQSCHTGTATANAGAIRMLDALVGDGSLREPVDDRFATTPDHPAEGVSLYRFSKGHGDLTCSACHGSPHAVYPTGERNDNIQSLDHQGHVGTLSDCAACHRSGVQTADGGPHGMHTIGEWWINEHGEGLEDNGAGLATCRACHGADERGTALSRAQGPRSFSTEHGTIAFWEGQTIGCYDCHLGSGSDDRNRNARPVAQNQLLSTDPGVVALTTLTATDTDPDLTYRIVAPPENGSLSISGDQVAYTPKPGFAGTDVFTFAAADGEKESNLGVVSIRVGADGESADRDGDGAPDLLERVLGSKRERAQIGPILNTWLDLGNPADPRLEVRADLRHTPPDLVAGLETSDDLDTWSALTDSASVAYDYRGITVYSVAVPTGSAAPRFIRLRAERSLP